MLCIFEEKFRFSTQIKNQRPEQFDGPVMKGCKWYSLKKEIFQYRNVDLLFWFWYIFHLLSLKFLH